MPPSQEDHLRKMEAWARKVCMDEKKKGQRCKDVSTRSWHLGRQTLAEQFLRRLTWTKAEKKTNDDRWLWCIECLWTGRYSDACRPENSELACPSCNDETSLRPGKGPRNTHGS